MKKLILGFFALFMVLPCFGEIHSKRRSEEDISVEICWDDTASQPVREFESIDMEELITEVSEYVDYYYTNLLLKFFITKNDVYIVLMVEGLYDYEIDAVLGDYENSYMEPLYHEKFNSFNKAKKEFDSLCAEYYKKLEK